jgi:predicted ATPase/class 3 adenylate cyclase
MATLPTGTVTFLFTDIEGSTQLVRQLGSSYGEVLEVHQSLLRKAFAEGVEVGTEGDSFFVAFDSATKAVAAAAAAQLALANHEWPAEHPVRVRMGLHTGEPSRAGDGYVGLDVHRAARIAAAGHGGQVLISDSTRVLAGRDLPDGVTVRDLGNHRLKDLAVPEHLHQLIIPGLASDFPAPRSMDARPNNLPTSTTNFVGRAQEVADSRRLLSSARLVTLTGPGGTGKTRLALEVAGLELATFADGVFLVPLAPISDPDLVAPTIASVLGVKEEPGRGIGESIAGRLRDATMLLVLDNFEQVLPAASVVADILEGAGRLRILVTSRAPLRIGGEQEYPVPPLGLSGPTPGLADDQRLPEAVALFAERARAVDPSFRVTASNLADVAAICSRLDGLPLAIELAAARVRVLSPKAILARLDRRLDLLAGGARDRPARQQTLRGAIDWSYHLLTAAEQSLFCRASVFVGGWSLEAMDTVCAESAGAEADLLGTLTSLIEQSLVLRIPGEDLRYSMLQTIREYARERLDARGESEQIAARHAAYFVGLAERDPDLEGSLQDLLLDRLSLDLDNLRAAIGWAVDQSDADSGLRITSALSRFWIQRDHITEGRHALATVLAMPGAAALGELGASATNVASELATWQSDYASARALIEKSLAIYRTLDDRRATAGALSTLGWAAAVADPPTALAAFDEGVEIFRQLGDERGGAEGSSGGGMVALRLGDLAGARRRSEEAVNGFRRIGDRYYVHFPLANLGRIEQLEGDLGKARARYVESLTGAREAGATLGVIWALDRLADLALAEREPERAVRVAAAAARQREEIGGAPSNELIGVEDHRQTAQPMLDETTIELAWAEGRRMSLEQAIDYALKIG